MPAFFMVEIEILDHNQYHEYIHGASRIIQRYGGECVFRSEHIEPLSKNWAPHRLARHHRASLIW